MTPPHPAPLFSPLSYLVPPSTFMSFCPPPTIAAFLNTPKVWLQATKLDRRTQEERNAIFKREAQCLSFGFSGCDKHHYQKYLGRNVFRFTVLRSSYMPERSQGRNLEGHCQSNPEQQQLKYWKDYNSRFQDVL